jgi:hypothetical protein
MIASSENYTSNLPRWIWFDDRFRSQDVLSEILFFTKTFVIAKHRLPANDLYELESMYESGLYLVFSRSIFNENFISPRSPVASFTLKIERSNDANEVIFTHLLISGKERIQSVAEFLAKTGAILPGSALIVNEKGGFTCSFGRISSNVDDTIPRRVSDVYPDVMLIDVEKMTSK